MQHTHRLHRAQATQAAHPASATDSALATEPAVATLMRVPALPAVAALRSVPALPAVATLQAVAALPTVPALRWLATLANVPALSRVAALASVPALSRVAALASVPALSRVRALANVPALTPRAPALSRVPATPNVPPSAPESDMDGTVGFGAVQINGSGALVAGGASGLGEATVRRLHASGASVVIADVNQERGQALAADLGEPAQFVRADVTDPDTLHAAVDAATDLRICVCCAGIGWAERIAGRRGPHSLDPFETVIRVNLIGTFNVLRLAAAAMLQDEPRSSGERGVCINTASIAAFDGQIGQVAYSASKGGIVGMTLPAARDLARVGIRVCTIAPGTFDTPLLAALPEEAREALGSAVPFPTRLGDPGEYAALAAHIVENQMLNGEVVRLDGALRMPPQ
jgi:NAD(P)-dependent dehydrogenase (short-subunit alcohol dehydrogenase family)